ncbi:hypothetical protein HMPREF3038_02187 [Akkermansia sp. KLE1797]|nr:hypothetical protein HMPREF3038_02187 [Akkermansia sp. KLE1797]KXU53477.1 hypothetical protein HMPREF3039_02197 [Akkermansia sp. KLE1798]KZA05673.1 hypothetical protein HMPREF1326_00497 [Akkermansia sp. KLE1605]
MGKFKKFLSSLYPSNAKNGYGIYLGHAIKMVQFPMEAGEFILMHQKEKKAFLSN